MSDKVLRSVLALVMVVVAAVFLSDFTRNLMTDKPSTNTASAPAPALTRKIGETFDCGHSFLAMLTKNDAEKAGELIRAGDKNALRTMALQGRVILIKSGTTVTLEDRDIWNVVESFRVRGNPDTRYMPLSGKSGNLAHCASPRDSFLRR